MSSIIDIAAWLWLSLLGVGLLLLWKRSRRGGLTLLAVGFAWWLVERTALPARLLAALEAPYLESVSFIPSSADAIVVLGGWGVAANHELLGLDFGLAADRLFTGIELARRGLAPVLVVGGAVALGDKEAPEPALVRQWIDHWDLMEQPVLGLGPSRSTRDEAMHVAVLAEARGWQQVLLVTSAWHMPRAEATFRAAGVNVVPVACDFVGTSRVNRPSKWVPQTASLYMLQLWLHEIVGFQYYRARGWIRHGERFE
jgi:uncharacterized SAM-binding protein YcdF (DUF218 family)